MLTATETATNVPAILQEQGRKVVWFCERANISQSYYHMIERGERAVPAHYLSVAAAILGVSVERLRREQ